MLCLHPSPEHPQRFVATYTCHHPQFLEKPSYFGCISPCEEESYLGCAAKLLRRRMGHEKPWPSRRPCLRAPVQGPGEPALHWWPEQTPLVTPVPWWHLGVGDTEGTENMALKEGPCSRSVPESPLAKATRQNGKSMMTSPHPAHSPHLSS